MEVNLVLKVMSFSNERLWLTLANHAVTFYLLEFVFSPTILNAFSCISKIIKRLPVNTSSVLLADIDF